MGFLELPLPLDLADKLADSWSVSFRKADQLDAFYAIAPTIFAYIATAVVVLIVLAGGRDHADGIRN